MKRGRLTVGLLFLALGGCGASDPGARQQPAAGGLAGSGSAARASSGGSANGSACMQTDADEDGAVAPGSTGCDLVIFEDCDDQAPSVHPGAPEVIGDGIDQDCDGADGLDCEATPWCPCDQVVLDAPSGESCDGPDFLVLNVVACEGGGCGHTSSTYVQVVNVGKTAARGSFSAGGTEVALSLAAGQVSPPFPVPDLTGTTVVASATEPPDCNPDNDVTPVPSAGPQPLCK